MVTLIDPSTRTSEDTPVPPYYRLPWGSYTSTDPITGGPVLRVVVTKVMVLPQYDIVEPRVPYPS